jgi:protein-L-isoaspartate(D-aspartate) O-methyltransferase
MHGHHVGGERVNRWRLDFTHQSNSCLSIAVGIDHIPELVEMSVHNIEKDQPELLQSGQLRLLLGDGRQGYPDLGPYDAIHVGAAAPVLPQPLVDQLKVI